MKEVMSMRTLWKSLPGKIFLAGAVIVGAAPSMAGADFKVTFAESGGPSASFDWDTGVNGGGVLYTNIGGEKKNHNCGVDAR